MSQQVTAKEIATALGVSKRAIEVRANRNRWPYEEQPARGGRRRLYPLAQLPEEIRAAIAAVRINTAKHENEHARAGSLAGRRLATSHTLDTRISERNKQTGLASFVGLSDQAKTRADAKLAILSALDEFTRASVLSPSKAVHSFAAKYNDGTIEVEDWVRECVPDIHPATLYRWRRALDTDGAAALAGRYKRKAGSKIDTQPELQAFCTAMLADHPHASAAHLVKAARARFASTDIELPSKRSFERWMNAWKKDNAQAFTALANPDAWKSRHMVAFGSASADVIAPNQRWEFDSTPADVMLLDGRHHIIGVVDVFSRRAKLLVSKTSKATAVATLTRRTILDWGVPEEAKTDNGADYVSRHMRRVFQSLGIEQLLCNPFSAWEKPHIERFFHTFSHDLVELLAGYIGHSVADRQAIEARKSFADRLFKKDQVVEVQMTAAELQEFCDRWVAHVYHHQTHEGLAGRTPFEVATGWHGAIRRIEDERALDVLLAEAPGQGGMRRVTKHGIRLDRLTYIHEDLGAHVGQSVHVRYDPDDLGRIYVFDEDGAFVCVATDPTYTGIDRKEVAARARQKQKAAVQEKRRELKRAARKANTRDIADEILRGAAEKHANTVPFPGASHPHTTPALHAAAEAAEARRRRMPERTETEEDKAALARLAADMRAAKKAPVVELHDTPEQRYAKAYTLERRLESGERVAEEDRAWLGRYRESAEYKAQRDYHEDFGLTPTWREAK